MGRLMQRRPVAGLLALAVVALPCRAMGDPPVSAGVAQTSTVTTPAPAASSPHVAPYVAGAIAVVAAGVGTAFGVVALHAKSNFERSPTQSEADSGNDYAAYSDAAFGAAVIAGVTSVVLFFAEKDAPSSGVATQTAATKEPGVTLTASPFVSPHGAGAGAVVHF
jgi:hypothetical protein